MLESCASHITSNHARNSGACGTTACRTYLPGNNNGSWGNTKESPILKAAYYLVEVFKGIVHNSNNESQENKQKLDEIRESKEDKLNITVIKTDAACKLISNKYGDNVLK